MPTTSDYLTQLEQDREDLVDNLETKGITGLSGDETFTELVPEVLNIPSGGGGSDHDWSAIGYSEEPDFIKNGYNYAVEIKNNWTPAGLLSNKFSGDSNLLIMPYVDTSIAYNTNSMFYGCTYLSSIPLLDFSNVTNISSMFYNCQKLKTIPAFDFSKVTQIQNCFYNCAKLETVPQLNLGNVSSFGNVFAYCYELKNVPILNTSNVSGSSGFNNMFVSCLKLTDQSLDNILQMCINATSYTSTNYKKLSRLGINDTSVYPVSRIEALPHYQDFIDAGWTIGY